MRGHHDWMDALRLHDAAADAFARGAEALAPGAWSAPVAEAKWSPAQHTDHLVRVYDVLLDELAGGPGMAIRTPTWQRLLLRFLLLPRLLRGAPFPAGARAPRETRPADTLDDQATLIARFRHRAGDFASAVRQTHARNPRQRLTHAYFGASSLRDSVLFCARHIQHHQRQLPHAGPGSGTRNEDQSLTTDDRGPRTEDRELRTEDRGPRTED